jgi:hypothetical protein
MAYDYAAARKLALKVITKFGAPGSVVKKGVSGGGFDNNGDPIPDSPDVTILGTVTPLVRFKTSEVNGTTIKDGDGYVMFDSEVAPEIDMQITINFETFRIVDIVDLSSVDDINIFRRLQIRR